jgi:hypothetical protein
MKATEWAVRFYRSSDLFATLEDYLAEMVETVKKRGVSGPSIEGVIREFDQKFRKIVSLVPGLSEDNLLFTDWDELIRNHMPDGWWEMYESAAKYRDRVTQMQKSRQRYKMEMAAIRSEVDPEKRLERLLVAVVEHMIVLDEFLANS